MGIPVKITQIIEHEGPNAKTFVFSSVNGGQLPSFRAGQYISVFLQIGESFLTRPYSICSSPALAAEGKYEITVENNPNGFAAPWMLSNFKVGDELEISPPQGHFFYSKNRDAKNVVALAGGSGITPFLSMAYAIRDGIEDFNLTILNGGHREETLFFKDELIKICSETDKVKAVSVLSDEKKEGFEYGLFTSDLIGKYGKDKYSVFICGPGSMYSFLKQEIPKLNLRKKFVKSESPGVTREVEKQLSFPKEAVGKTFEITVKQGSATHIIKAFSQEPVLIALERAGIRANSSCRSGVCGWCKSRLIKGTCFVPKENDKRKWISVKTGKIHPCASFPVSDLIIELKS